MTDRPIQLELEFEDLTLVPAGTVIEDEGSHPWLIDNIWWDRGNGVFAGVPKIGKTWLVISMAVAVASGKPFLGRFAVQQGPVVLYSPEGTRRELHDRISKTCQRYDVDPQWLELFVAEKNQLELDVKSDQEIVEKMIDNRRPRFVIFDPLANCLSGDENRVEDVRKMTMFMLKLSKTYSVSTMIVHHMARGSMFMRGSSALEGFGDSYIFLEESNPGKSQLRFIQKHRHPLDPLPVELTVEDDCPGIAIAEDREEEVDKSLEERILELLKEHNQPMSVREVRETLLGDFKKYGPAFLALKNSEYIKRHRGKWVHADFKEHRAPRKKTGQAPGGEKKREKSKTEQVEQALDDALVICDPEPHEEGEDKGAGEK